MFGLLNYWRNIIQSYKSLIHIWYLWLFPMTFLVFRGYLADALHIRPTYEAGILNTPAGFEVLIFLSLCMGVWITMIFCLAAKASAGEKNLNYFKKYMRFFVMLVFSAMLFSLIPFLLSLPRHISSGIFPPIRSYVPGFTYHFDFFAIWADLTPLWVFYVMFFLDSDGSVKQLWYAVINAVKMVVYNLPLLFALIVSSIVFFIWLTHPTRGMGIGLPASIVVILGFLFKSLVLFTWATIYMKSTHERPGDYVS